MVKTPVVYFFPFTKYIVSKTVSIHQLLGCYSVNCLPKIDFIDADQKMSAVEFFELMENQSIKHLTKSKEKRAKEYCQAASGF